MSTLKERVKGWLKSLGKDVVPSKHKDQHTETLSEPEEFSTTIVHEESGDSVESVARLPSQTEPAPKPQPPSQAPQQKPADKASVCTSTTVFLPC